MEPSWLMIGTWSELSSGSSMFCKINQYRSAIKQNYNVKLVHVQILSSVCNSAGRVAFSKTFLVCQKR